MASFRTATFLALLLCAAIGLTPFANAQETESESLAVWPNFRGPDGNGVSATATPPTTWSPTENIAWKQKIPGRGSSSPIVVGSRVYITAAVASNPDSAPKQLSNRELIKKFDTDENGKLDRNEQLDARRFLQQQRERLLQKHRFLVLCYDRSTGDLIWQKTAIEAKPHEPHHSDHGFASASPVSDGRQLYVNFGSRGLFCYDLEGNLQWKRTDLGKMKTRGSFGEGSSVAVHENFVILPWDHEGQSRIEAMDRDTGETIWKTMRDEPSAWVTPIVVKVDNRKQVLISGQNFTRGYDLETGREIWRASGMSMRPVASPAVLGTTGYFSSARGGAILQAIALDQKGDISQSGITWSIKKKTPDIPSLLLSKNRLYFVDANNGILSCVNAETGDPFFGPQRLQSIDRVYSSPVAADGNIFITGRNGKTSVVRDAVTFGAVSTNDIGEPVDATLALADSEIFIRGKKHLFCIRNQ